MSFAIVVPDSAEGALLGKGAISSQLLELGYPLRSVRSFLSCGVSSGEYLERRCDCFTEAYELHHRCNLRVCSFCSKTRKRRIRRRYLPVLGQFFNTRLKAFRFLTISPENYSTVEGIAQIRKDFSNFLRRGYSFNEDGTIKERVSDRIDGGIWVIEAKTRNCFNQNKGWNIHLHCILYGRYLDNKIRGKCFDCGQSYIKMDRDTKKYYCANRKCNSTNLVVKEDSKLVSIWREVTGKAVNIDVRQMYSSSYTLNYMLKYVSANKDDFFTPLEVAQYVNFLHKKKLINMFGVFTKKEFRVSIKKEKNKKLKCFRCGSDIVYSYDSDIGYLIKRNMNKPPDLLTYVREANAEGVVLPIVSQ